MLGVGSGVFSRLVTGAVSTAVAVAGLQVVGTTDAGGAPSAPVPPGTAAITEKPDVLSATLAAKATGKSVEVTSARTETNTTFANPDGSFTVESHTGQIRFRDKGQWRDVDLALVAGPDGAITPRGHALGLRLAGKTSTAADLVTVNEKDGRTVTLSWPTALPKPELKAERATYRDVQPGVDMVVEARRTGFEQYFILDGRPTAGPVSWSLGLKTKGLTARVEADGSISFLDSKKHIRSTIPAASAWDSQVDELTGDQQNTSHVALSVVQKSPGHAILTITPDAEWLADPETVYPVTVDPTYASATRTTTFDTYVQQGNSTPAYASGELRLGKDASGNVARSLLEFELGTLKDKWIKTAELRIRGTNSQSCDARTWEAWSISGDVNTSTVWTNQPTPSLKYGSSTQTKGFSASCPDGEVAVPLGNMVGIWASDPAVTNRLMLRAANETDASAWKRYASSETSYAPYVRITYNRPPNVPNWFSVGSSARYDNIIYTRDDSPELIARASDPDLNNVRMDFQAHTSTAGTAETLKASCTSDYVAAGTDAKCSITTLPDNATYYMRSRSYDGNQSSNWSAMTAFKVAAAAPATPTITCAGYGHGSWTEAKPAAPTVPCTISAPGSGTTIPTDIRYSIDDGPMVTAVITPSGSGSVAKVDVSVSNDDGRHSIRAWAISGSDKLSDEATHTHGYGKLSLESPAPGEPTISTGNIAVKAVGPAYGTGTTPTATLQWRLAASGDGPARSEWNNASTFTGTIVNGAAEFTGVWDTRQATNDAAGGGLEVDARVPVLMELQVCFNYSAGDQCTSSTSPTLIRRVPHAFGEGFPVVPAGPGRVALWTGEFTIGATDVEVPGYNGGLSISRTHATYAGVTTAPSGVFGPGWIAALDGPDIGVAGMEIVDNTLVDGTIVLSQPGETPMFFAPDETLTRRITPALTPGTYVPADAATALTDIKVAVTETGSVVVTQPDGVVTTFQATTAPTIDNPSEFAAGSIAESDASRTTVFSHDSAGRATRILAALPTGMTASECPQTGSMHPGCRALTITYASSTTATAETPGDVAGQVKKIEFTSYDPARDAGAGTVAGMDTKTMATYAYDDAKRLVEVTDNISGLVTKYAYAGTRLTTITEPGLAPVELEYHGTDNKLARIKRDRPSTSGGGTATLLTVLYGLPLSGAGLPTMTDLGVEAWGQLDEPTYGVATFGPNKSVGTLDPAAVPSGDWRYAALSYTDARGYTVNTATYGTNPIDPEKPDQAAGEGWLPTYTDYDDLGNVVLELDASHIAEVTHPDQKMSLLEAGVKTVYNTQTATLNAGAVVTDVYGPVRTITKADGTTERQRPHTHTVFDEGAPAATNVQTGQDWALPTTVTVTASTADGAADIGTPLSMTKTEYGTTADDWQRGMPTKVTTPMAQLGGTGSDIVNVTAYDDEGRVIEQRQPNSDGTGSGTRQTVYYTVAANPMYPECGAKPQWAGMQCLTKYAGAPTLDGAAAGPALPVTRAAGFNWLLAPTTVTETADGAVRTTSITYDSKLRVATTQMGLTGLSGSTPVSGSEFEYDNATGALRKQWETTPTGARTGALIESTYDSWGRTLTYTPEAGYTTSVVFNGEGRVASVQDPKGVTSYTYDGTDASGRDENRGLVTRIEVTRTGGDPLVFTGAYDIDGNLAVEKMPGAITRRIRHDEAGNQTGLVYSGQVTVDNGDGTQTVESDAPWLGWSQDLDLQNQVIREWTPSGAAFAGNLEEGSSTAAAYSRAYTYDPAGRLITVVDKTVPPGAAIPGAGLSWDLLGSTCQTRKYTFDINGNRTGRTLYGANADGTCSSTGANSRTWGYDTADRISAGYSYDKLGRVTTLPEIDAPAGTAGGNVILGYHDSDAVRSISQGGITTTFSLELAGRRAVETVGPTGGPATRTLTSHYTDRGDNPAWVDVSASSGSSTTRYVSGLNGDLGATITTGGGAGVEVPVVDLRGNTPTVVEVPNALTAAHSIEGWANFDEYGNPITASANGEGTDGVTYGWLGGEERAVTGTGLVLMGARLYNRTTGQFTSADPIYGGNSTSYTYPTDPINSSDTTGLRERTEGGNSVGCKCKTPGQISIDYSSWERLTSDWRWISKGDKRWQKALTYAQDFFAKGVAISKLKIRNRWKVFKGKTCGANRIWIHQYFAMENEYQYNMYIEILGGAAWEGWKKSPWQKLF